MTVSLDAAYNLVVPSLYARHLQITLKTKNVKYPVATQGRELRAVLGGIRGYTPYAHLSILKAA
jgi:hypothetical protein